MSWFTVLPDSELAARAVPPGACTELHGSGRPWLVGRWSSGELVASPGGGVRVAVIGQCSITAPELTRLARLVRTVRDVDLLARMLPGSAHLIASVYGEVRVQGTASGVHRVFHAAVGGVTIAADRADVLATLFDARPDETRLAAQLLAPGLPYPLLDESPWLGVHAVEPGHALLLHPSGRAETTRWWLPPQPDRSIAEGAPALRGALRAAIADRTRNRTVVSADLSGGMDSTSLCFLTAPEAGKLITIRSAERDAGNDDASWAATAIGALPLAEHVVLDRETSPAPFAGAADVTDPEEPYRWIRHAARSDHTAAVVAERGSELHLAGHGGDEVLTAPGAYLRELSRRRPVTGWRHLRGHRALRRWPRGALLRELARIDDHGSWLAGAAEHLTEPRPRPNRPSFSWGLPLRMPPWATPAAVEATRELLREAARHSAPLAESRAQHLSLAAIHTAGRATRQAGRHLARAGVPLAVPFLDDRVIEAALAVRPEERTTPWRYKPLLVAAMRGIVPGELLGRCTKGEFGSPAIDGLRRHQGELLARFGDSELAARGLIDLDVLRSTCLGIHLDNEHLIGLDRTLACEVWLQAQRTRKPWRDNEIGAAR